MATRYPSNSSSGCAQTMFVPIGKFHEAYQRIKKDALTVCPINHVPSCAMRDDDDDDEEEEDDHDDDEDDAEYDL